MSAKRKEESGLTKEKFVEVYNKYQPKGWVKFAFRYFSKDTVAKDMKLSQSISWILIALFLGGFVSIVANFSRTAQAIFTYAFAGVLALLVGFLGTAVVSNNRRIRRIARELGVSLIEYNELVDKWGDELK